MSLVSVVNMIYGQVPQVTPATGGAVAFYPWDTDGACIPIEQRVEGDPGAFDVVVTVLPVDDGAAAVTAWRYRAGVAVRIWYQRGTEHDRRFLQGALVTDAASLLARLLNPNNWTAAEGLDTLDTGGTPTTQILHDGAVVMMTVPFTAIYYEG